MKSAAAIVVVAMCMLLTGCGSDDENDDEAFKKGAQAATTEVTAIGQDLATAIRRARTRSNAQLAREFSGLTARTRETVEDLGALEPPDASRKKVDDLESALDTGADDLAAVTAAIRENDAPAARRSTETLLRDSPAIRKANAALKAAVADFDK
jgi:hypothetical protein